MLVVSDFLLTEIKPLIAKLIYDPNDQLGLSRIVELLTQFGNNVPGLLAEGSLSNDQFQRYNNWLKEFLVQIESKDYVRVLQGLHSKVLK